MFATSVLRTDICYADGSKHPKRTSQHRPPPIPALLRPEWALTGSGKIAMANRTTHSADGISSPNHSAQRNSFRVLGSGRQVGCEGTLGFLDVTSNFAIRGGCRDECVHRAELARVPRGPFRTLYTRSIEDECVLSLCSGCVYLFDTLWRSRKPVHTLWNPGLRVAG